jgi:hypothetical protein
VVLSEKAVFGFGCSFEEHVKYGMCLDGQCARRAKWEDVSPSALRTLMTLRLATGDPPLERRTQSHRHEAPCQSSLFGSLS